MLSDDACIEFRVGIFGFADLDNFWCLARFEGFLQFCLRFSVFVNNDDGFSDCFVQCILRFFGGLPRRLHPAVLQKTAQYNSTGPLI